MLIVLKGQSFLKQLFISLGYREYRLIWSASMIHHLGEWMEMAGILWFVQQLTGSPFLTSLAFFMRIVPMAVLSIPAGLIADRMSRRSLMIWSKGGAALISIALAVLAHTGWIAYWHILLLSVLSSFATSINMPARQSIIPNIVRREHLMNAITLDNASMMSSRLIGAPLAGILLLHSGVTFIFGLRAITGIIASMLLIRLPRFDPVRNGHKASPLEDLRGGFRYLKRESIIMALLALFFLPMFSNLSYMGLLPAFATQVLGLGAWEYGLLQLAPGVGAALCMVSLAPLHQMRRKGLFLFISGIAMGLALVIFALSRWLLLSMVMLMVVGGMNTAFMTVNATLVQGLVIDEVRGRVMGWREMVRGFSPVGSLLAGSIADIAGAPMGAGVVGAVMVALSLLLLFLLPRVRHLD